MPQLLSFNDLKTFGIPYSKSHLYHLMSRNLFPRPLRLSENTVAWVREDVEDWVNEKIKAHRITEGHATGDAA